MADARDRELLAGEVVAGLVTLDGALQAIAAARAQEREECAKVADLVSENLCDCDYRSRNKEAVDAAEAIAAAIRNRKEQ